MKKILIGVISILSIFHVSDIYAQTGDVLEEKSIKEIKQNIEKLNSDKNLISTEYSEFKLESDLSSYFKTSLPREDLQNIEILIKKYNVEFTTLNDQLSLLAKNLENTEEVETKLLQLKKDLYLNLLTYINPNKYQEYLEFIRGDATISKKQVEVKSEIISSTEIYEKKVNRIEEKIIENKKEMALRLQKVVSDKIDEKIVIMKNNESFKKLSTNLKIEVIEKTIEKINVNIASLESLENVDSSIEQKINLYYILNDKLLSFKNDISNIVTIEKKQGE